MRVGKATRKGWASRNTKRAPQRAERGAGTTDETDADAGTN
jgi:hypothetical protein